MSVVDETQSASCPARFEFVSTRIEQHRAIALDTWRLTFIAPELARRAIPGQFFMIRIADQNDPLIGRPLAMYDMHCDSSGQPNALSVVYTVKGKFSQSLSRRVAGDRIEVWGPLGNCFSTAPVEHLILVAGGVGQTPMLTLASAALGKAYYGGARQSHAYAKRVTLCYGARTKGYLAGVSDFERVCSEVRTATEDGTHGHHGRVTDLLRAVLDESNSNCRIACCGPEPMMEAVSEIAREHDVLCEVSLETPMACGIGICFTCVAKIKQSDGEWDYRRTCIDGPIFDANKIVWH
ncbi:MAG: dihydroorotate dehydrogenase electron transfer subunit [Pirellula sp.]